MTAAETTTPLQASLNRLPADSDVTKIIEAIKQDGAVILTSLLNPSDALKIADEVQGSVDSRSVGWNREFQDEFWGSKTVRIQGIVNRSQTWLSALLMNPILHSILDEFLLPHCGDYWLSQAELIYLAPGEHAQKFHRDDVNWLVATQLKDVDLQLNCLLALGDYDTEVGATRVVPGSHLWPIDRKPQEHEIVTAEMDPGDCFLYSGRVLHGGGDNKTKDRVRKAMYNGFILGWLTPEEAIPLTIAPEHARSLPKRAQELLGLASVPNLQTDDLVNSAMQLWQIDPEDVKDYNGAFHNR